ncbi:MAG: mechanosensitive ion channel [Bacteroidales bacterium]|nr:mechanosensitive ion channel [Bacteroidales bacterium]
MLPLDIVIKDTVNVADSAKAAILSFKEQLAEDPSGVLSNLGSQAINFGLKVVAAIVIYLVGAWIIKRVKKFLNKIFEKKGTDRTIATFVTSFASITLTVLLIIITISELGVNTTSLAALLAAGGMAIGMALSGTVQNFAGGIMLLVFKPFKAGDYIKALGYEGFVTDVNIVSTKIRTFENCTIILPNGALANGNIDNFSQRPIHRCSWAVNVAYGSEPEKVRQILLDMFKGDDRILDASTEGAADPSVNLKALNASTIEFSVWAWVKTEDYWPVTFKYNEELYKRLPQNGVSFAFPQMDVFIKNKD